MTDEHVDEPNGVPTEEPDDAADATPADRDDEGIGSDGSSEGGPSDDESGTADGAFDLKGILRQFTAPMIESLDARLREQVEAHVEALLTTKVDAAVADRLSTVDRAIADLSRSLARLEDRLDAHDRGEAPVD